MMQSEYYATLARYNAWANRRVYRACGRLSETEYLRERRSTFGSLHATLNHVLIADRIWLAWIEARTPPNLALDQILYGDLIGLKMARVAEDAHLCNLVASFSDAMLDRRLAYRNQRGDRFEMSLRLAFGHMYNHQAHYRGEAAVLLAQSDVPPPSLDLTRFVREERRRAAC
jgi:uncharacterized damage-inducible protein DinB